MARKCVLCGKEYEYCPSCPKDMSKALWHKLYDSENCRNIFEALNNYNFKLATKEETRKILAKYDLSIELNDHYRGEIEEIMKKPEKVAEVKIEAEIAEIDAEKEFAEVEVKPEVKQKAKYQPKKRQEEDNPLDGVVTIE